MGVMGVLIFVPSAVSWPQGQSGASSVLMFGSAETTGWREKGEEKQSLRSERELELPAGGDGDPWGAWDRRRETAMLR